MNELLTPEEAAATLRLQAKTLANWRAEKAGPRWVRVGGLVRYRRADLDDYLAAQSRPQEEDEIA